MLLLKLEQDFWLKVLQIFISVWEILTYVLFVTVFSEVKIENISDKLLLFAFFSSTPEHMILEGPHHLE